MRIIYSTDSIFTFPKTEADGIIITTNGVVKPTGYAVMGKGIAKEANDIFKCSLKLGMLLRQGGNHCYNLGLYEYDGRKAHVLTFPTKNHWRFASTTDLIEQSAIEILQVVNDLDLKNVYLPPAGCGNGGLRWNTQVRPILTRWLDDRFIAILNFDSYNE